MGKEKEFRITDNMEPWMIHLLANAGIDREFKVSELTAEQKQTIALVADLKKGIDEGLILVRFHPKNEPEPLFIPSAKLLKAAGKEKKVFDELSL